MVYINKVYTKSGDKGETSLVGGRRVNKDHIRIEAYGTIDELNSIVGICTLKSKNKTILKELNKIQHCLFDLGSELATHPQDHYEGIILIPETSASELERWIDNWNKDLKALKSFVLPGGNELNAFLHLARTVSRRAERIMVSLSHNEEVRSEAIIYMNRLSDYFFVLSRAVIAEEGAVENLWKPGISTEEIK